MAVSVYFTVFCKFPLCSLVDRYQCASFHQTVSFIA